jgi:hypothetical protein
VPSDRKIRNSWSISESPGKRGRRTACRGREAGRRHHFGEDAAKAPDIDGH